MNTRIAIVLGLLWLALLLAACAQVGPAPVSLATATRPAPAATYTPSPSPTSTPAPTPTATPELRQLTTGSCCVMPSWSPDSRQVLFIDKPSANDPVGVYALDILTGALDPLQWVGRVGVYSKDRSLVAYLDKSETVVERLSTGEKWTVPNVGQVVFAPDDQHLAWDEGATSGPYDQRYSDVYVSKLDGADAVRVTRVYGGGLVGWLPRGSSVMILGRPSLDVHERTLTVLDLATKASVNLVTAERISDVSASPDGTWVAYSITFNADQSRNGIWMQRTDGSQARRLELWGAYQWRDDSHLLVIPMRASSDQAFEVWQVDAATGGSFKLTDAAATPLHILNGDWRASPDGRYIVYLNRDDRNVWLLKLPVH